MNLNGKLLVAPPGVDGFWKKTTILITDHGSDGTLGVIINKPTNYSLMEFGHEMNYNLNAKGYLQVGGPINTQWLAMIHTADWIGKHTMPINQLFAISSADDIIPRLSKKDAPRYWRLMLGLCAWAPGQLEDEIEGSSPWENDLSWCVVNPTVELLFKTNKDKQWKAAIELIASEFSKSFLI